MSDYISSKTLLHFKKIFTSSRAKEIILYVKPLRTPMNQKKKKKNINFIIILKYSFKLIPNSFKKQKISMTI